MQARDIYLAHGQERWLPWGALAPVLCIIFVIASALSGTLLLKPFIRLNEQQEPGDAIGLMAFTVVIFAILLLVLFLWVRVVEGRSLAAIGLVGDRRALTFLRGHVIGSVSMVLIVATIWLAGGYAVAGAGGAWRSREAMVSIALLLPCFAVQSSAEELLFRGWLLSVLSKKFNVIAGVLVSSAVFTLLHYSLGQQWWVTAGLFLFSVFCCCWALRARNVLGVMGWHSGWNWVLAVGFDLPLTGLNVGIPPLIADLKPIGAAWLTGATQGPEGSVVAIGYFVAGIAVLITSLRAHPP